ncbi:hypothetical protein F5890DRAFT_1550377 [Lentinula detonsa]|uniref:HMG box domain-containing protein n=3 Tax=Lentinula TaxID=5352 RepID=A0AA38Q781_9AGAR|nr:hypothetical protein F5890DRAFT_1550377 [Lentinula detonsa]
MSRVFGWKPSQQDKQGELCPKPGQIITFPVDLGSPASDTTSPTSKIEEVLLQPTRRPKKGDPDYVPRPENCFIIFRNEWVRRNARGPNPNRSRGKSSAIMQKRMSKRASEAWNALPQSERNHFKTLADQRKVEHAQAHPEYRYRPNGRRNRISHLSSGPSRTGNFPSRSPDSGAGDRHGDSEVGSSSVPVHVSAPSPSPFLHGGDERLIGTLRRSRSHAMDIQSPFPAPSPASDSWGREYPVATEEHSPISAHGYGPTSDTPTSWSEYPLSTTGSSSLAGWNGEPIAPSLTRVPSSTLSTPILSSWTASCQDTQIAYLEDHQYSQVDGPYTGFGQYGADHFGMHDSAAPAVYWCPQVDHNPVYNEKGEYDTSYPYNLIQHDALANFNFGLTNEVSAPGESMPFDMPYVDEQRVYEQYNSTQF